jgi:hypothetical protein
MSDNEMTEFVKYGHENLQRSTHGGKTGNFGSSSKRTSKQAWIAEYDMAEYADVDPSGNIPEAMTMTYKIQNATKMNVMAFRG